jgi:hypothetical protein
MTEVGIFLFEPASTDWTLCSARKFAPYPAFRTAPVQLNDAAAVPVAFALYGEAMMLSPSSSSDIAVVKLIRSSSLI